jgi:hypothetical protein
MQQSSQYAAHMCVVVDDEETQTVEIDANHGARLRAHLEPDTTA